ncbi:MAG: hypothetical protein ACJA2Q_001989 [Pseudohongiellaceae bacterium]|jgi:hypothetical protein
MAVERQISINTQKTALNAIAFLFEKYLKREMGDLGFKLASKRRLIFFLWMRLGQFLKIWKIGIN